MEGVEQVGTDLSIQPGDDAVTAVRERPQRSHVPSTNVDLGSIQRQVARIHVGAVELPAAGEDLVEAECHKIVNDGCGHGSAEADRVQTVTAARVVPGRLEIPERLYRGADPQP